MGGRECRVLSTLCGLYSQGLVGPVVQGCEVVHATPITRDVACALLASHQVQGLAQRLGTGVRPRGRQSVGRGHGQAVGCGGVRGREGGGAWCGVQVEGWVRR